MSIESELLELEPEFTELYPTLQQRVKTHLTTSVLEIAVRLWQTFPPQKLQQLSGISLPSEYFLQALGLIFNNP